MNLVTEFYGRPEDLAVYMTRMLTFALGERRDCGLDTNVPRMHARYLGWVDLAKRPTVL